MDNIEIYLKNLTGKDEKKAQEAAKYLIDNSDVDLFSKLIDKTDYLFDFVRNNVFNRIKKAINNKNFKNIINFFSVYSSYYDDLFAYILAEHADENLTDEIFDLLEKGNNAQKTYAAKYFYYIPDTIAIEPLGKYAFSDDENLSYNSAQTLGQMQDDISYDIALGLLYSDDDFEKLKAVKFFTAYQRNYPIKEIFAAMKISKMPENIAGQIPYAESILALIENQQTKEDALSTVFFILSGLGEILPVSDVFQFELFDIAQYLILTNKSANSSCGKISVILLKMYSKFLLFTENQEYIFDESNDVKYEVNAIYKLLKAQNESFWNLQKEFVLSELEKDRESILQALGVITECSILSAYQTLIKIINTSDDEIILYEALSALKSIKKLTSNEVEAVSSKIKNTNIKAIIDNMV